MLKCPGVHLADYSWAINQIGNHWSHRWGSIWPNSCHKKRTMENNKSFGNPCANVPARSYAHGQRIPVTWQLVDGIHLLLNDILSQTSDKCDWAARQCRTYQRLVKDHNCIQASAAKIITVFQFQCLCPINFPKKRSRYPGRIKWTFKM